MSDGSDISVIICTHTEARWDFLVEAVNSVLNQYMLPIEIIVVVDHNPGLLERVKSHFPKIIAIENIESQGASGSKNSGVYVAKSSIVAFLDDDAFPSPDWIEQLTTEFTNLDILGVGGTIEPRWVGKQPDWLPVEFYWVIGCTYRGLPLINAPVRNLIACNMAVRKQVFCEAGGFRDNMGPMGSHALGCEETEFCIRVNQIWPQKIWLYKPAAIVYHQVPASRIRWKYFLRRCYGEGRSKALVTYFVGKRDGLASERAYVLRFLPHGIVQGMKEFVLHANLDGLARSAAIFSGLAFTITGYVWGLLNNGRIRPALKRNPAKPI